MALDVSDMTPAEAQVSQQTTEDNIQHVLARGAAGVSLRSVTKKYGQFTAVENLFLDIPPGSYCCLLGPSGCGKTYLIFEMLRHKVFKPVFDKVFYFYQHDQPIFHNNEFETIEYVQGVNFDMINQLPADGTNNLLIFDDSCEEICRSKEFQMLATAGRHRKLNVIYIKHNLFHKSPLGRDI